MWKKMINYHHYHTVGLSCVVGHFSDSCLTDVPRSTLSTGVYNQTHQPPNWASTCKVDSTVQENLVLTMCVNSTGVLNSHIERETQEEWIRLKNQNPLHNKKRKKDRSKIFWHPSGLVLKIATNVLDVMTSHWHVLPIRNWAVQLHYIQKWRFII